MVTGLFRADMRASVCLGNWEHYTPPYGQKTACTFKWGQWRSLMLPEISCDWWEPVTALQYVDLFPHNVLLHVSFPLFPFPFPFTSFSHWSHVFLWVPTLGIVVSLMCLCVFSSVFSFISAKIWNLKDLQDIIAKLGYDNVILRCRFSSLQNAEIRRRAVKESKLISSALINAPKWKALPKELAIWYIRNQLCWCTA